MIQCSRCGQFIEMDSAGGYHHDCPIDKFVYQDDGVTYSPAARRSVIVDGIEYWLDDKKLEIILKIINL